MIKKLQNKLKTIRPIADEYKKKLKEKPNHHGILLALNSIESHIKDLEMQVRENENQRG